jgi:hypothetical protein
VLQGSIPSINLIVKREELSERAAEWSVMAIDQS